MAEQNFPDNVLYELDNLDVLRGMNSETVDLIATDPPFNTQRNRSGTAGFYVDNWKWGDTGILPDQWAWNEVHPVWLEQIKDDKPALYEVIDAARACHGEDIAAFLCFLSVRLLEMHRVLKPAGSIYLHCDHTANAYIRMAMDAVFGPKNFRNEIVWNYRRWPAKSRNFQRMHDTIYWYSKGTEWTWNQQYEALAPSTLKADGGKKILNVFDEHGHRVRGVKTGEDSPGALMRSVWDIGFISPTAKERTGSPDQKPLALYERIILASSNPGDLVLDPFAGCATTIIAARKHGRRWVGVDRRKDARFHVVMRMMDIKAKDAEQLRKERPDLSAWLDDQLSRYDAHYAIEPPERTDSGEHAAPELEQVFFPIRGERQPWQRLAHAEMQGVLNRVQAASDGAQTICAGCGRELEWQFMELDHITPRADGGENYITNRVMLCRPCNGKKKHNLTLSGLRRQNRQDGWMKDEPKAQTVLMTVQRQTQKMRDSWSSPDVQALILSVRSQQPQT